MKLDSSALAQLSIARPGYDRSEIGIGMVYFGVGGFHRAHQAANVDTLLENPDGTRDARLHSDGARRTLESLTGKAD